MTLLSLRPAGSPEDIHRRNHVSETKQNLSSQWTKVITHKLVTDCLSAFQLLSSSRHKKQGGRYKLFKGQETRKHSVRKAETSKAMDSGEDALGQENSW